MSRKSNINKPNATTHELGTAPPTFRNPSEPLPLTIPQPHKAPWQHNTHPKRVHGAQRTQPNSHLPSHSPPRHQQHRTSYTTHHFLHLPRLRTHGTVLVHCALGINCSAAAVLTYLCHVKGCDSRDALEFWKTKKGDVKSSVLFMKQIDPHFGRGVEEDHPLVGFHRRLKARKDATRLGD